MHLILLEAVSKPIHHHQLISRRKVSLNPTSAACLLHGGGVVSFVVVTGGVPPVSVASHIDFLQTFIFAVSRETMMIIHYGWMFTQRDILLEARRNTKD